MSLRVNRSKVRDSSYFLPALKEARPSFSKQFGNKLHLQVKNAELKLNGVSKDASGISRYLM